MLFSHWDTEEVKLTSPYFLFSLPPAKPLLFYPHVHFLSVARQSTWLLGRAAWLLSGHHEIVWAFFRKETVYYTNIPSRPWCQMSQGLGPRWGQLWAVATGLKPGLVYFGSTWLPSHKAFRVAVHTLLCSHTAKDSPKDSPTL